MSLMRPEATASVASISVRFVEEGADLGIAELGPLFDFPPPEQKLSLVIDVYEATKDDRKTKS